MKIKRLITLWWTRYLPADIIAFPSAILSAIIVGRLTNNIALTSIAATWGENIGYYGFIFFRDLLRGYKKNKNIGKRKIFINSIFSLAVEFGPAEILDTLFVRPLIIFSSIKLLNNTAFGVMIGKVLSDILFIGIAMAGFTLKKKISFLEKNNA